MGREQVIEVEKINARSVDQIHESHQDDEEEKVSSQSVDLRKKRIPKRKSASKNLNGSNVDDYKIEIYDVSEKPLSDNESEMNIELDSSQGSQNRE